MQINDSVSHTRHVLPRGRILTIRDARDTVLQVLHGSVWVTQERDSRDLQLGPGDRFQLDRDGLAIVQAYERSAFTTTRRPTAAP